MNVSDLPIHVSKEEMRDMCEVAAKGLLEHLQRYPARVTDDAVHVPVDFGVDVYGDVRNRFAESMIALFHRRKDVDRFDVYGMVKRDQTYGFTVRFDLPHFSARFFPKHERLAFFHAMAVREVAATVASQCSSDYAIALERRFPDPRSAFERTIRASIGQYGAIPWKKKSERGEMTAYVVGDTQSDTSTSTSTSTSAVVQVSEPPLPLLGSEPLQHHFHLVYRGDRPLPRIEVRGGSVSRLDVAIRFKDEVGAGNQVLLAIVPGITGVRIQDLTGSGEGGDRNRRGYGLLAVNLAFQALKQMYGVTNDTPVTGAITDDRPAVANFWRQFGAWDITEKSTEKDGSISGTVGDFKPAERNRKAGDLFDLRLDLSKFSVVKNLGAVDKQDVPSSRSGPRP